MSSEIETRMEAPMSELSPELRALAQQYIKSLSDVRIDSYESLLAAVQKRNSDIEIRKIGCWILGKIGDERAVRALLEAFGDENISLSGEAAKSLGLLGSKQAVRLLIASLLEAEAIDKRVVAAYALGLVGDERALEPLLQVLLNDTEQARLRGEAAEALAMLGDTRAVTPLINSLKDNSPEVRFWAAYALGELGDKRALPELGRLAATDKSILPEWGTISSEAANAIEQILAKEEEESEDLFS